MSKFSNEATAAEPRASEFPPPTEPAAPHVDVAPEQQPPTTRFASVIEPEVDSFMNSASIAPMLREWLDQNLPDMVEDRLKLLLRPLLKDWFDTNLPTMVDRIVHDEVERIVSATSD